MPGKNYPITAGRVLAGIPATVPNDVSDGVWTPTADAYGRILDASWANLPLNEFVAVAGTPAMDLNNALAAAGLPVGPLEQGTTGIRATFNAWVGCAVDQDTGRVFVDHGGGHIDSSINGCWEFNLEYVGGWSIFDMPSDPYKAGFEWVPEYRDSAASYTNYPDGTPPRRLRALLPDGRPTSSHIYNGIWFNYQARTVETSRQCRISRSVDNKGAAVKASFWTQSGSVIDPTINAQQFYDRQTDSVIGYCRRNDIDATNFVRFQQESNEFIQLAGYNVRSADHYGRKIYCFSTNSEFRVFDLDSLQWDAAGIQTTWQSSARVDQELTACVYVPQWGKIIRRYNDGQWFLFNPVTDVNEDWVPVGNVPPATSAIGKKYFYYEKRKCIVCISVTTALEDNSIFIMRVE